MISRSDAHMKEIVLPRHGHTTMGTENHLLKSWSINSGLLGCTALVAIVLCLLPIVGSWTRNPPQTIYTFDRSFYASAIGPAQSRALGRAWTGVGVAFQRLQSGAIPLRAVRAYTQKHTNGLSVQPGRLGHVTMYALRSSEREEDEEDDEDNEADETEQVEAAAMDGIEGIEDVEPSPPQVFDSSSIQVLEEVTWVPNKMGIVAQFVQDFLSGTKEPLYTPPAPAGLVPITGKLPSSLNVTSSSFIPGGRISSISTFPTAPVSTSVLPGPARPPNKQAGGRPEGGRGNARFDDAQGDGVGESGSADGRDSQTDEELGSVRSEDEWLSPAIAAGVEGIGGGIGVDGAEGAKLRRSTERERDVVSSGGYSYQPSYLAQVSRLVSPPLLVLLQLQHAADTLRLRCAGSLHLC